MGDFTGNAVVCGVQSPYPRGSAESLLFEVAVKHRTAAAAGRKTSAAFISEAEKSEALAIHFLTKLQILDPDALEKLPEMGN